MEHRETLSHKIVSLLERRSGWFILSMVSLTMLLAIPMVAMIPDEDASDNPGGPVYDLEDLIDDTLPPRIYSPGYVVEAKNGDILTREPLLELLRNTKKLREADQEGDLHPPDLPQQPYLYDGFDADREQPVIGVFTIADAVQEALQRHPRLDTDLEHATDEEVKFAVHLVFNDPRTDWLKDVLSEKKAAETRQVLGQDIEYWTSPAIVFSVFADNGKLGGGGRRIGATSDPVTEGKEHFNRKVQTILRGKESSYRLWGVAIDASLEIADEVSTAVPFIVATFIMVLVVVGFAMRSGRVVFLTAFGLVAMIIWLKGLSNLVGLKSSTILDFIVPIAMISLGADFLIHAVHRYRQERKIGLDPRSAFRTGIGAVLVALVLAMVTDSIAFLSNTSADIETVIGFGIGAALAVLGAFVILGITVPLALMRWDTWIGKAGPATSDRGGPSLEGGAKFGGSYVGRAVVALARGRLIVLPIVALITGITGYFAFQLEARFDVKDFFKGNSDFVVGLDKLDVHVAKSGGEPAIIYIQGDLADPTALEAIQQFLDRLAENPYVAVNDYGEATIQARIIFSLLDQVLRSDYARAQIELASPGVTISTDEDIGEFTYSEKSYLRPNSREELTAKYDYIVVNGVPLSPTQNIYDRLEVEETVFHDPTGVREDATVIVLGIPGTREQTNVIRSRESLTEDIKSLEAAEAISTVGFTGSPYTRQAALDATADGLQRAFLIAILACLVAVVVGMRSWRFGIITIIPIGLVVAWLYGFMYVFGFRPKFYNRYNSRHLHRSRHRLLDSLYAKISRGTCDCGGQGPGLTSDGGRHWKCPPGLGCHQRPGLHYHGVRANAHVCGLWVTYGGNDFHGCGGVFSGVTFAVVPGHVCPNT